MGLIPDIRHNVSKSREPSRENGLGLFGGLEQMTGNKNKMVTVLVLFIQSTFKSNLVIAKSTENERIHF